MASSDPPSPDLAQIGELARETARLGEAIGLPFVAATADIGSTRPMRGPDGKALAETTFRWVDPTLKYWNDREFALKASFIHAARSCAEPFFFADGKFGSWRPMPAVETIDASSITADFGIGGAIIAPAHMPGGVIGVVVWAASSPTVDVRAVFEKKAAAMHALAMRLLGAYRDAHAAAQAAPRLTKREIQCLKWAAIGKTDAEAAEIMGISLPTVRFHIRNAATKLGVMGRAQATHRASVLGYVGDGPR